MLLEALDPNYLRVLQETLTTLTNTLLNIARAGFDDSSRVRTRVEYIDDGYVRVRDTSATIDILEMLREFTWVVYNISETNTLISRVVGTVESTPPEGGVVLLGFDGSVLRRVKVTEDGKLLAVLG